MPSGVLRSEVSPTLVTPELWPAPDSQDSAYRLVTRVTHMSLGKWPALLGGSAITLDIKLPHSFRSLFWMICILCLTVACIMSWCYGSLWRLRGVCATICMQTQ